MVGVLDYGAGNIFSITNGLKRAGLDVDVFSDQGRLKSFDALVIPGVGSFSQISTELERFRRSILEFVKEGRFVLGICLGMQVLLDSSEEGGGDGLGLIEGRVKLLPTKVKIPHMGWNTIEVTQANPLVEGLPPVSFFYFVHSYYASPESQSSVVATTRHGVDFASIICKDSLLGVQFHPEKSGKDGAMILNNFRRLLRR